MTTLGLLQVSYQMEFYGCMWSPKAISFSIEMILQLLNNLLIIQSKIEVEFCILFDVFRWCYTIPLA
jgi:hypothetical protein